MLGFDKVFEVFNDGENGGCTKRHASDETRERELDDVSDPERWEDETQNSITEAITAHPLLIVFFTLIGLITIALAWGYLTKFVPTLINRTWRRRGVVGLVIGVLYGTYHGRRQMFSEMQDIDDLLLVFPNGVKRYWGEYKTIGRDECFEPIKGFSKRLRRPTEKYTIREFSSEYPDLLSKADRGEDEPVRIGLHSSMASHTVTGMGTVVGQLALELDTDETGKRTDMRATVPDDTHTEQLRRLREELQKSQKDNQSLRRENAALKRRLNDIEETLEERDAEFETFLDRLKRFREAYDPDRRETERGIPGPSPNPSESDGSGPDDDLFNDE